MCDEQTRLVLIEKMLLNGREQTADDHEAELKRKYGYGNVFVLIDISPGGLVDCFYQVHTFCLSTLFVPMSSPIFCSY